MEYQQAGDNPVRFSGRLDRPLLRTGLMGLSVRKAALSSDWDTQGSAQSQSPADEGRVAHVRSVHCASRLRYATMRVLKMDRETGQIGNEPHIARQTIHELLWRRVNVGVVL